MEIWRHKPGAIKISALKMGFLVLIAFLFLLPNTVFAAGLAILDCEGFTRALKDVDPLSKNNVQFNVLDKAGNLANNVEVTLTNSVTGETVSAVAQNGVASFEGLSSGSYVLGSTASGVSFSSVSIATSLSTVAAGGAVAGAGIAAGGTVAGAGVVVNENIIQDDPPPPPPGADLNGDGVPDGQPGGPGGPGGPLPPPGAPRPPGAPPPGGGGAMNDCPCTPFANPDTFQSPEDFFGQPPQPPQPLLGSLSPSD